jgi:chemotaxis protein CheD
LEYNDYLNPQCPSVYFDREFNCNAAKIGPGGYYVSTRDLVVVTVLGSCVSACLYDPVAKVGGMNHFMLPEPGGDPDSALSSSARYGAYAMELLINHLLRLGAERERLVAKVFGAGSILNVGTDIGERNAQFVLRYLAREEIRVAARDLGGAYPRKVYFFVQSGRVLMKQLVRLNNQTILVREKSYAERLAATRLQGEVDLF